MGEDPEQGVARFAEADHDASPELVDAHGADAVVAGGVELLEVDTGVGGILELFGQLTDLLADGGL
ncbi:MAG: hypothetical protein ACR2HA_13435 [Nocardioides sp.]